MSTTTAPHRAPARYIVQVEADGRTALLLCPACSQNFMADISRVTLVRGWPICHACIERSNRVLRDLDFVEIPEDIAAYRCDSAVPLVSLK